MGRQDFTTCQPDPSHPPSSGCTQALGSRARGLLVPGKHHRSQNHGKRWHLMPSTMGHGHMRPCAPDSRYFSTRIYPIAAWHSTSITGTRIIAMMTLMLDELILIKAGFSMRDWVHQGPRRSTPLRMARPEGFTPPERWSKAAPAHATWWDRTVPIRRLCTSAC
jgi:hypothetical protein